MSSDIIEPKKLFEAKYMSNCPSKVIDKVYEKENDFIFTTFVASATAIGAGILIIANEIRNWIKR